MYIDAEIKFGKGLVSVHHLLNFILLQSEEEAFELQGQLNAMEMEAARAARNADETVMKTVETLRSELAFKVVLTAMGVFRCL